MSLEESLDGLDGMIIVGLKVEGFPYQIKRRPILADSCPPLQTKQVTGQFWLQNCSQTFE